MRNFLLFTLSCICVLLVHVSGSDLSLCHGDSAELELVTIDSGTIRGVTCPNQGYSVFKGIPYGASTAGANRWRAPQPVTPWTDIRDTLEFAPSCPQPLNYLTPIDNYSEDCLSINVWTPSLTSNTTYPVMVWIYGGAFVIGSGNIPAYWGDFMANTSNIVLVNLNHRLGPLGFLNGGELTGNYGFLDQQAALRWVQTNIHAFNGDPDRVTISGQSAGAMSVGGHLISPASKGLFQRAIMESNTYGGRWRTRDQSHPISAKLATEVGCDITDLKCLRAVDVSLFNQHALDVAPSLIPLSSYVAGNGPWGPIIDGTVIPGQPIDMMTAGQFFKDIPVLMGTTKNETAASFATLDALGESEYEYLINSMFGTNGPKVLSMFPGQGNHSILPFRHLMTAYLYGCSSRYVANIIANNGGGAFLYEIFHVPSHDIANPTPVCITEAVCHAMELPYVFGSYTFAKEGMTDAEKKLSTQFMKYWAAFIHGAPMTAPLQPDSSYPAWLPLDNGTYPSLVFDIPLSTTHGYQADACDMLDAWQYVY